MRAPDGDGGWDVIFAETLDYGYPQILTPNMLQLYITQKGVKGAEEKVRSRPVLRRSAR